MESSTFDTTQLSQSQIFFFKDFRLLPLESVHMPNVFGMYAMSKLHVNLLKAIWIPFVQEGLQNDQIFKTPSRLNGAAFVVIVIPASFWNPLLSNEEIKKRFARTVFAFSAFPRPEPALTLVSSCSCTHFNHASFRSDWIFIGLFTLNHRQPLPLSPIGARHSQAHC